MDSPGDVLYAPTLWTSMPSWPRPPNYGWAMRTRLRLLTIVADVNAHVLPLLYHCPDCDLAVSHQVVRIDRLALFAPQP
jgi:hypothetical protein